MTFGNGVTEAAGASADPRRKACPMGFAGAISKSVLPAATAGLSENARDVILRAPAADRYARILEFVDARVGALHS